jgi:DNA-binding transcriptional LysR family regulator
MFEREPCVCDFGQVFDWGDLRYLLAVSRAGSFAGAAREIGVKHTTVARRIGALELALGARLVTKGKDKVSLTEAGAVLRDSAEEMEKVATSVERRLAGEGARVEGVVRVTMPDAFAHYVAPRLPRLRERHPKLSVHILADARVYDLEKGEADLALRIHPSTKPHYLERKLCSPTWAIYASRAYVRAKGMPKSIADLHGHELIGPDAAAQASPGAAWLREHLPDAKYEMRFNGVVPMLNAVTMGLGISPLPCFLADPEENLVRVLPDTFQNRGVRLVVHPDVARVARVRAVMDFLSDSFKRDAKLWAGELNGSSGAGRRRRSGN